MRIERIALGTVLVAGLLLFLPRPGEAQEFGLKGGWILADAQDAEGSPLRPALVVSDRASGLAVGGFAVVPLGSWVSLQPEVLFTRREIDIGAGPDIETVTPGEPPLFAPVDSRLQADYLEVPVLLRVSLGGEGVAAHGLLGPSLAVNLAARLEHRIFPRNSSSDAADAVRDLDVGLVLGGGITLGEHLVVEGRYNVGLVDIRDDEALLPGVVPPSRWRSVGLMVGLVF